MAPINTALGRQYCPSTSCQRTSHTTAPAHVDAYAHAYAYAYAHDSAYAYVYGYAYADDDADADADANVYADICPWGGGRSRG